MKKIILASQNAGKLREFSNAFKNTDIELIPQNQLGVKEIIESGKTFIENAILKARHACQQTKLPAIADDSGLLVHALNHAPGLHSARYAGDKASAKENIQKLLAALKDIPDEKRQAYFYCVLVYLSHENDPTPIVCEAKWHGRILHHTQGEQGFGYDPIFYVPTENKSAAELPLETKNQISHRGQALRLFCAMMPSCPH